MAPCGFRARRRARGLTPGSCKGHRALPRGLPGLWTRDEAGERQSTRRYRRDAVVSGRYLLCITLLERGSQLLDTLVGVAEIALNLCKNSGAASCAGQLPLRFKQ